VLFSNVCVFQKLFLLTSSLVVQIDLSRRGLDVSHAFLLKEAITHSPQLSVLKLAYNEFCDEGTTILAMAFCQNGVHHKHLSVVDLAFNEIGDMGCEALAVHAMAGNYVLRAIDLSGNQVGERGALSIAGAILHGTGLSRLHMSANRIGSMGVQAIAGAIANRDSRIAETEAALTGSTEIHSIVDLQLGTVLIASGGFAAIPGMLVTNTTLRSLCVSNNNLDDQDILLMSQALTQNKRLPLEELVLSFNQITCQGVETLMNSIWGSTTLKEIKLDNNRLRDRGAQLCAVVLTSIPLQSLDIGCNAVTSAGIKALMKNVSENSSLISLGLAGIHIDQNSSKAVSYALAYNTSLQAVYFDNSHAGYSAQRHIVAGIISNQSAPLRLLTGFPLAPIAVTLGVPRLPEVWSNDQVLGFFRLMWRQWAIKAGRGNVGKGDIPRGPAPPAAVAAAAKVAFASLGTALQTLFQTEMYEKPISERPSVDPSDTALLERSLSGTLEIPKCSFVNEDELSEWEGGKSKMDGTDTLPSSAHTLSVQETYENSERRSRNLRWLRLHFRSLSEVGRIPFNNAELWHLHQYYFSPPNVVLHDCDGLHHEVTSTPARGMAAPSTPNQQPSAPGMGRAISFQSLGNAFSVSRSLSHAGGHKRRSEKQCQSEEQPALKRPKNSKPRIAYYPRIMTKLQALGSSQADQILALLRQLKFAESLLFAGKSLYCDEPSIADNEAHYSDVEMILLDLL
jgi:Ran GTPase-activating protein (RanGAP) involved in mRNA processing and transport